MNPEIMTLVSTFLGNVGAGGQSRRGLAPWAIRAEEVIASLQMVRNLRGPAPDAAAIWKVQFACNPHGAVTRFSDQGRKQIGSAGFQAIEDLLPEDHSVHVSNSLRHDRPQLITGKLGSRVYSWEYRPTNKGKSVRVTVTDVTEHTQLTDHNVQQASLSEALDLLGTGIMADARRGWAEMRGRQLADVLLDATLPGTAPLLRRSTEEDSQLAAELREMIGELR